MKLTFADGDDFMRAEYEHQGGSYQRSHLEQALKHVKQFRGAVDGGAHVGTWAIPLAKVFSRVDAFEPSEDTYIALRENILSTGTKNITTHRMALGSHDGWARMALDPKQASRRNLGARYVTGGSDVQVVTLDSFHFASIDFIKLDVEGSEPAALEGARETLRRCRPVVLFEDKWLWNRYGLPARAPHDFLASLGAREIDRIGKDAIWGWD